MTSKLSVPLSLAVLVSLLAIGVARAEIIEEILVKVNGEIFTKTDLENRQIQMLRQRGQQIDLKADRGNAQLRKALDEVTPGIVVDSVNEMLIVQRGRELGYKLSDDQFKQIVENIKKENKIDTEEQWQAALKQENMTMDDLRRQLERSMIIQRVQQNEVFGKIAVSDDEGRKYYEEHTSEFTTPASVTLREILVAVPTDAKGLNVAQDDAAKERAEQIRARAAGGESFEKLASEVSDAPSKTNAGLIGPISLADISPELRSVIQAMKPGDITPVVRGSRGYQILKLETMTASKTLPFDEAREQISERVFTSKRRAEWEKYLAKLRSEAIIQWMNDDIKKAFEAGLQQQETATAAPSAR